MVMAVVTMMSVVSVVMPVPAKVYLDSMPVTMSMSMSVSMMSMMVAVIEVMMSMMVTVLFETAATSHFEKFRKQK